MPIGNQYITHVRSKINVDIEINSDMLNQLPKYKAGFDNLRNAVNNLNKEIVNSTDKLSKLDNE